MATVASAVSYEDRLHSALVRRRFEPVLSLEMRLPLSIMTDRVFCNEFSKELYASGRSWEIRKATAGLGQWLPASPGLYMFVLVPPLPWRFAQSGRNEQMRYALYVGKAQTGTLKSRYQSEYQKYICQNPELLWDIAAPKCREELLRKYLNLYPLEYWYLEIERRELIGRMERDLIRLLNPPLNNQGKMKLKPRPPIPAFTQGR